jgi:hypothetical protein
MNQEHAMSTPSLPTPTRLGRHDFLRFDDHRARRLQADCGTLWVTLDGETADIEIDAGQCRVFDGHAALTVGSLGGPAVMRAEALPDPRPWAAKLRAAAQRWWLQAGGELAS